MYGVHQRREQCLLLWVPTRFMFPLFVHSASTILPLNYKLALLLCDPICKKAISVLMYCCSKSTVYQFITRLYVQNKECSSNPCLLLALRDVQEEILIILWLYNGNYNENTYIYNILYLTKFFREILWQPWEYTLLLNRSIL